MNKEDQKKHFLLIGQMNCAVQSVAAAMREFRDLIPYVTLLAGAITDLSDTIGSDPERALRHLQAVQAVKKLQKKARVGKLGGR